MVYRLGLCISLNFSQCASCNTLQLSSRGGREQKGAMIQSCPGPRLWLSRRIKTRAATLCHHTQPQPLCSVLSQPHAKAAMPCLRGHSPSHQIHCDMAHHQGSAHCDVVTMSLGLVIGFHTGTSPQLPLEKDCRAAFVHGCGDLPAPCKTRMVLSYLSCRVLTTLSEWHWRERTGTCCGLHVHLFGH